MSAIVRPELFGQRRIIQDYYLPSRVDLPDGMDLKALIFDYGFNNALSIKPLDTGELSFPIERNFLDRKSVV